jgi:LmeA-like phospholipid-binding
MDRHYAIHLHLVCTGNQLLFTCKLGCRNIIIQPRLAQLTNQTRGIVGSVLAPACRVWLRSQVSQVDSLHVDIQGGSRQILGGTIPRVAVVAVGAIYQGLALGSIDLVAEHIQINLPQVLKGKPLKLLTPIAVMATAKFSESNLQTSLAAPLLSQAITDLFTQILSINSDRTHWSIDWQQLKLVPRTLILQGNLTIEGQTVPIAVSMGIAIEQGHILNLDPLTIDCAIDLAGSDLDSYQIDLGDDVNITQLDLLTGSLLCQGRIQVNP